MNKVLLPDFLKKLIQIQGELFSLHKIVPCWGVELEFYIDGNNIEKSILEINAHYNCIGERGDNQYEIILEPVHDIEQLILKLEEAKSKIIEICKKNKDLVIFSAKPKECDYGNAMQLNLSLYDSEGHNVFYKDNGVKLQVIFAMLKLIDDGGCFYIAAKEEEYERFVPKFMSPTNVSWGGNNRTTLLRIPTSDSNNKRIEFRLPSPISCHYRGVHFLLMAIMYGLSGENEVVYEEIYGNAFDKQYDLKKLPSTLLEAKKRFSESIIFANLLDKYKV